MCKFKLKSTFSFSLQETSQDIVRVSSVAPSKDRKNLRTVKLPMICVWQNRELPAMKLELGMTGFCLSKYKVLITQINF